MSTLSQTQPITVIPFESPYSADFARLNYEWLEKYFTVEPHDREMLDAPESYIIESGGQIFFAKLGEEIVGTVALIYENEESYELAKMAVSPDYQGLKIGQLLMEHAIQYSREQGKKSIVLESNTKLTPAINLYIKNGFKAAPLNEGSPYARCNIRMELVL